MRKLFIALLSALLCLLLSVSALAADGLSTFQETQTYQPGMFSDVKAGSWYEAGVRAVYTRGIMNGTGGKAFAPSQTITWAQAAAIAARIHAACGGAEIAAAEGQWYEPYLAYAAQAKLLPSTCPEGVAAASTTITRQELAGLFANVLRADDLPRSTIRASLTLLLWMRSSAPQCSGCTPQASLPARTEGVSIRRVPPRARRSL